ncbi:hypothetical protein CFR77_03335 [Komagataeibacter sucrofermentans]|uniref:Uncharacterized protein n=1 Tax=Komagataeibacter sucrofermentans TaxID=1053551 RepID=A0A318QSU7_9PROT|nr:hypothetical protein CFR77_03335 [Komagataeibacter sucrofermentans]
MAVVRVLVVPVAVVFTVARMAVRVVRAVRAVAHVVVAGIAAAGGAVGIVAPAGTDRRPTRMMDMGTGMVIPAITILMVVMSAGGVGAAGKTG